MKLRRGTKALLGLVVAAGAAVGVSAPAQALSYSYMAGHPMYGSLRGGGYGGCTGSWTIYGTSGSFILTAGHCFPNGARVSGTSAQFGTVYASKYGGSAGDSEIIRYDSGVTPYQMVVDPKTGRMPGDGKVTGTMPTSQQGVGWAVGKMGVTTGWTEGTIAVSYNWQGVTAKCATYASSYGDSGGPVWRMDANGLRAVGMHVGSISGNGVRYGCYIPIDTLLAQWGAKMNVFPRAQAAPGSPMRAPASVTPAPLVSESDGWVFTED